MSERSDAGETKRHSLELAILQTVAYADVFDYPLTVREVHRYLVRRGISPERLHATKGKPVDDAVELDQDGKPRRRFVEIIIDEGK